MRVQKLNEGLQEAIIEVQQLINQYSSIIKVNAPEITNSEPNRADSLPKKEQQALWAKLKEIHKIFSNILNFQLQDVTSIADELTKKNVALGDFQAITGFLKGLYTEENIPKYGPETEDKRKNLSPEYQMRYGGNPPYEKREVLALLRLFGADINVEFLQAFDDDVKFLQAFDDDAKSAADDNKEKFQPGAFYKLALKLIQQQFKPLQEVAVAKDKDKDKNNKDYTNELNNLLNFFEQHSGLAISSNNDPEQHQSFCSVAEDNKTFFTANPTSKRKYFAGLGALGEAAATATAPVELLDAMIKSFGSSAGMPIYVKIAFWLYNTFRVTMQQHGLVAVRRTGPFIHNKQTSYLLANPDLLLTRPTYSSQMRQTLLETSLFVRLADGAIAIIALAFTQALEEGDVPLWIYPIAFASTGLIKMLADFVLHSTKSSQDLRENILEQYGKLTAAIDEMFPGVSRNRWRGALQNCLQPVWNYLGSCCQQDSASNHAALANGDEDKDEKTTVTEVLTAVNGDANAKYSSFTGFLFRTLFLTYANVQAVLSLLSINKFHDLLRKHGILNMQGIKKRLAQFLVFQDANQTHDHFDTNEPRRNAAEIDPQRIKLQAQLSTAIEKVRKQIASITAEGNTITKQHALAMLIGNQANPGPLQLFFTVLHHALNVSRGIAKGLIDPAVNPITLYFNPEIPHASKIHRVMATGGKLISDLTGTTLADTVGYLMMLAGRKTPQTEAEIKAVLDHENTSKGAVVAAAATYLGSTYAFTGLLFVGLATVVAGGFIKDLSGDEELAEAKASNMTLLVYTAISGIFALAINYGKSLPMIEYYDRFRTTFMAQRYFEQKSKAADEDSESEQDDLGESTQSKLTALNKVKTSLHRCGYFWMAIASGVDTLLCHAPSKIYRRCTVTSEEKGHLNSGLDGSYGAAATSDRDGDNQPPSASCWARLCCLNYSTGGDYTSPGNSPSHG
ncbi:MAG: hypothetical protein K0U12_00165 [Gammaproteobacteria bacterium]|nr:hypothetical protein [Gammaproteobacteria bacterium]